MTDNNDNNQDPKVSGYASHPNVQQAVQLDGQEDEGPIAWSVGEDLIRDKILHCLKIYPRVSGAMLQVGIGTSVPPKLWRPVYQRLIQDGIIEETHETHETPSNRMQSYIVIKVVAQPAA